VAPRGGAAPAGDFGGVGVWLALEGVAGGVLGWVLSVPPLACDCEVEPSSPATMPGAIGCPESSAAETDEVNSTQTTNRLSATAKTCRWLPESATRWASTRSDGRQLAS
jgi:hypothetical protein